MRTAVLEISQIFEDSLHDHQVELAHKGEEIAHLKVKLQRAEFKLKNMSVKSETNMSITQIYETSKESEESAHEESAVSEIDFRVPDDWCVPLSFENVDQQEIPCPSVRLKQFSIPLSPIPLKHEKITKPRLRPRQNRDKKDSHGKIKPKGPRKRGQPRIRPLENDIIKVEVVDIKEEPFDYEVKPPIQRKGLSGKVQKTHKHRKRHRTQDSTTGQMYHCRFCPKVFDTAFGLRVHDRAHKKCIACKKVFPFPSVLKQHEGRCKYYKELMRLSNPLPKNSGKPPSIKQISEKGNTSLVRRIIKQLTCKKCLKRFTSRSLLLKHSCNFACPVCSEMFTSQMNLKVHTKKMHNNSTDNGLEQSWAQPLDETEGNQGLSSCEIYIRKCSGGFQCVICKKVCVTKCNAVDHYYSHTGEKPYTCDVCSKKFSKTSALNHHSITTHGMHIKTHKLMCPTAIAQ
ncbi:macrophage migration inhibitory factor isoform X1 [Boleophthalmus pectinirostris]|uniref:macrophage migration inhibitory factor isoform X1 n=1 Tax=Boleophthalmus pectinirostris TaxID=150288 RepID=UPI000A1C318E|nr:macrophage migration inhibitory factor isoform X1 [Boleophthalmus pectinirostris]XP_020782920.1 macrophage migration inhibitory factor isoform X1 [Boleophthalmus pectinirostris]XP_055015108.1 macrophage migration inhibitory factor isoform X1 [Boleophthalmus pectinirostris]